MIYFNLSNITLNNDIRVCSKLNTLSIIWDKALMMMMIYPTLENTFFLFARRATCLTSKLFLPFNVKSLTLGFLVFPMIGVVPYHFSHNGLAPMKPASHKGKP